MKKYSIYLGLLGVLSLLTACSSNPIQGRWQFSDGSTVIGLTLAGDDECELSLSRFIRDDLKKSCRYEPNKEVTKSIDSEGQHGYLLFLKDEAGRCDVFPDFEFFHDEVAGLVTFLVGDTPFIMQKTTEPK